MFLGLSNLSLAFSNKIEIDNGTGAFDLIDNGTNWRVVWDKAGTIFLRDGVDFVDAVASGTNPSLVNLTDGRPVIVYENAGQVMLAEKDLAGSWQISNQGSGSLPSLGLGVADKILLTYSLSDGANNDIWLKTKEGGVWTSPALIFDGQNIGSSTESFSESVVAFGSDNNYRILAKSILSGAGGTNYYLKLATNASEGATQSSALSNGPVLSKHSLVLDGNDDVYAVFDSSDASIFRVYSTTTGSWQETQIGSGTGEAEPTISFKTGNGPVGIAYNDGAGNLQFISGEEAGGFSAPALVDSGVSAIGAKPALALGTSNKTLAYVKGGKLVIATDYSIADTIAPRLSLLGSSTVNLFLGGAYVEPGYTAFDNIDGDITNLIATSSNPSLDINATGTYQLIYSVSDNAGNSASTTRTIVVSSDTVKPVITLIGASPFSLTVGQTFSDPGATASDDVDGNISSRISVSGTVNTSIVGTYTLTYSVSDNAGNSASTTRTVLIQSASAGGGGGGGSSANMITTIAGAKVDLNNDGRTDLLDFNLLMVNWGKAGSVADLNKDGKVDLLDFNLLMVNWGKK